MLIDLNYTFSPGKTRVCIIKADCSVLSSVNVMLVYLLLLSDAVYVRKAYELIRASAPAASDGRSLSELCVLCAEQSLQVPS